MVSPEWQRTPADIGSIGDRMNLDQELQNLTGRSDIKIPSGEPCICGYLSLEPQGKMGGYLLWSDDNGEVHATPTLEPGSNYYTGPK